ncbi:hypothetical protein HPB49_014381 [Dermacentor silvarum]|uniref:Uncharacterized protein n=1 Tax=Dermacentor silvarum TaxID=543639 RepID=A0ACB8C442_DERSI|nr:hypothetical protein HPB49_014381 [Dermacentor silvarum]
MPLIKLWNADHTIKKVAQASSLEEVLAQAKEKGICNSANAKVFLRDWTELEEEIFSELLSELPLNERVFVVAEIIPVAPPGPFLSVKEEWPLLFVRPFFYGHADKLLGKNVKAIFQEKMLICAPQMMHLMELTPRKETMRVVVHVHDVENENDKAVQVALLPLLCAHFKDDEKCLFQVFEVSNFGQIRDNLLKAVKATVTAAVTANIKTWLESNSRLLRRTGTLKDANRPSKFTRLIDLTKLTEEPESLPLQVKEPKPALQGNLPSNQHGSVPSQ